MSSSPFLNIGQIKTSAHLVGKIPKLSERLNIFNNGIFKWDLNNLKTSSGIPSGPGEISNFKASIDH